MFDRRDLLKSAGAAALIGGLGLAPLREPRAEGPILTEDGLYKQSWFLDSFLELQDDLETSASNGKRLAIMWELKGCPYCKETHFVNFADPEISGFIRERFDILQLNIIGSRNVLDFDGEELPEKELAQKYGMRFTPSFQFFPLESDGLADKEPREREVARMQGYMKPEHFYAMFRYVDTGAYESQSFRDFLKAQS
ncbi:thioredoxin family protein [Limibacillus halophilus]|jgi:thioredoxin-related protein